MKRRAQRGFTLVTTVMLVSLATVSGLVLLDTLISDGADSAQERRAREARVAAEGGLMELINDRGVLDVLPDPSSASLEKSYSAASDSRFQRGATAFGDLEYDATVRLVRVAPMLESSHSMVRAVMYEVDVNASADGRTAAGVQAEIYKVAASKVGVVRPRLHAR